VNVEVRHDIAEQQIVDMTRLEHTFDGPSDLLYVRPIFGELAWRKIGEGRDVSAPKHHRHMAVSDGVPFKKSLADPTAVEGPAGQIGTKGTSDTLLARFPILRPGSFDVSAHTLWSLLDLLSGSWSLGRNFRLLGLRSAVRRGVGSATDSARRRS
jgi:hypothetical protein